MLTAFQTKKNAHFFNLIDADGNGSLEPADWSLIGQRFAHAWKISEESGNFKNVVSNAENIWNEISKHLGNQEKISLDSWLKFVEEKLINGSSDWYDQHINGVVDGIFAIVDEDKNGTIDWREYVLFLSCLGVTPGNARIGFDKMDLNGDGTIDKDELSTCVKQFVSSDDTTSPGNSLLGPIEE